MKKEIWGIGDVHLSVQHPWFYDAGEEFLKWLSDEKNLDGYQGRENTEAILVGDLTEKDVNPGLVVRQLVKLLELCQKYFSTTYILVGNHDLKLYHNVEQHSIEVAKGMKNIIVFEEITEVTTPNGFNCLMMPYVRPDEKSCYEFYTEESIKYKDKSFDIIAGHFNKKDMRNIAYRNGVEMDNYHAKDLFLGHIHNRVDEDYIGSVHPNNVSENWSPYPRGIKVFDEYGAKRHIEFPIFLSYEDAIYPEELPKPLQNSLVQVWTVNDCPNVTMAAERYPGIYISGTVPKRQKIKVEKSDVDKKGLTFFESDREAFDSMIEELNYPIKQDVKDIVYSMLPAA